MSSIVIRFPDGAKEFRHPGRRLQEGDTIWHDGAAFRVISESADGGGKEQAIVEPASNSLGDILRSEEGAIRLEALDAEAVSPR